jgi:hypothetical protein
LKPENLSVEAVTTRLPAFDAEKCTDAQMRDFCRFNAWFM